MPSKVTKRKTVSKDSGESSSKKSVESEKTASDDPEYTHWLMKSEPESRFEKGIDMKFGIDDLIACPDSTSCWDGVRNYSARNFMRAMKVGQQAFFYHSNTKPPGIIGVVDIVKDSYVDHTQFDPKDPHYDPKSSKVKAMFDIGPLCNCTIIVCSQDNPKWSMVDVKYVRRTKRYIPLEELKQLHLEHKRTGGPLAGLSLFTKARLSVMPVTKEEWDFIIGLESSN